MFSSSPPAAATTSFGFGVFAVFSADPSIEIHLNTTIVSISAINIKSINHLNDINSRWRDFNEPKRSWRRGRQRRAGGREGNGGGPGVWSLYISRRRLRRCRW